MIERRKLAVEPRSRALLAGYGDAMLAMWDMFMQRLDAGGPITEADVQEILNTAQSQVPTKYLEAAPPSSGEIRHSRLFEQIPGVDGFASPLIVPSLLASPPDDPPHTNAELLLTGVTLGMIAGLIGMNLSLLTMFAVEGLRPPITTEDVTRRIRDAFGPKYSRREARHMAEQFTADAWSLGYSIADIYYEWGPMGRRASSDFWKVIREKAATLPPSQLGAELIRLSSDKLIHGTQSALARPGDWSIAGGTGLPQTDLTRYRVSGSLQIDPTRGRGFGSLTKEEAETVVDAALEAHKKLGPLESLTFAWLVGKSVTEWKPHTRWLRLTIDELLELRGLAKKKGGKGEGGYRATERARHLQALQTVFCLTYAGDVNPNMKRRRGGHTVERPFFLLTGKEYEAQLQLELAGVRTGELVAIEYIPHPDFAGIFQAGGELYVEVHRKLFALDFERQEPEICLALFLLQMFRISVERKPFIAGTLLDRANLHHDGTESPRFPRRVVERLEKALDTLRGIAIDQWFYVAVGGDGQEREITPSFDKRGWFTEYCQNVRIRVTPPPGSFAATRPALAKQTSPEPMDPQRLRTDVEAHRAARGLSQSAAAAEIGLPQPTLSNFLTGRRPLSPTNAEKVRQWLNRAEERS